VGDAAVLFDPSDPEAIAEGIAQALKRGPELAAAGVEHVKKFTWESCLDVHLVAYAAAAESRA
jgi:glycosyltransferase involved in cell wall biosynthesis